MYAKHTTKIILKLQLLVLWHQWFCCYIIYVFLTYSYGICLHESFSCQNVSLNQIIYMNKVNNRVILAISEGKKASLNIWLKIEKYKRCEFHQGWRSGSGASRLTCSTLGVRGWKVIRIKKQSIKGLLVDPKPSSLKWHHSSCKTDSRDNYSIMRS